MNKDVILGRKVRHDVVVVIGLRVREGGREGGAAAAELYYKVIMSLITSHHITQPASQAAPSLLSD